MTANEYMKKIKDNLDSVEQNLKKISVNPQEPKTGHWIVHEIESTLKWLECSNCHCETSYNVMHNYILKSVIEDIRAEIEHMTRITGDSSEYHGLQIALEVIDKHTSRKE